MPLTTTPIPSDGSKPIFQIVPAGPGTTPGTVTGSDGKPTKFIVPQGAFITPGTIPGPDGNPVPVEPEGPGNSPGVQTGPNGNIIKIVIPTTTPLPPPPGPLDPASEPIAPFGPGNVPNSPKSPGNYPGYSFQFPGYPDAPGSIGPLGYLDFSQLPSSMSPEMEGNIGFLPDFSSEIGGPFPGFPPGPDNSGPGGFLNVHSLPDFVNPGYGFPGSPQAPLGFLNFSLLPDDYNPGFPGQLVFPGYPGSPGSSGQFPGGFLSLDELPEDVRNMLNNTFSLPELLHSLQPLFPGRSINSGVIPKDNLQNIPGFSGTYDNLRLSNIGDNNNPTGGVFYLPEMVRLISYLPVGSFPNGPGTINQNGGFGHPFNFPGLNGAPGYICDYLDNIDVTGGSSDDLGGEIRGNDNGPSGDVADAAPGSDVGAPAPTGNTAAPSGQSMSSSKLQPPENQGMPESDCDDDVFSTFMKARSALMDVSSSTGVNPISQLTQDIISGINPSEDSVDYNKFFNKLSSLLSQVRSGSSDKPNKELLSILMEGLVVSGLGVSGSSVSGLGVSGSSVSGLGVSGSSVSGLGVSGSSVSGLGVSGSSVSGLGVSGSSVSGLGVSGLGVSGSSVSGLGVSGSSVSGLGVSGSSVSGLGVSGSSVSGLGVSGSSVSGLGVSGSSDKPNKELLSILMEGLVAALEALNAAKISGFRDDYYVPSDVPVYTSFLSEILY
uniref:Aggregate spider glue 2 n=1 Tax=Trichonephila clavipes TaxID=2585209 RepID=B7SVM7_TRICX|nr:aggregate spider glue 2 [Trichonephila clavipes]